MFTAYHRTERKGTQIYAYNSAHPYNWKKKSFFLMSHFDEFKSLKR